jgi:predicted lipoprotein with Yx(FWY)xxD motif
MPNYLSRAEFGHGVWTEQRMAAIGRDKLGSIRFLGFKLGLRQWVSVIAPGMVAVLAACGGDDPTATSRPATSTASASGGDAAEVNVGDGGALGDILVDGDGMTLYLFDNDTEGVSNCSGGCLNAWPPLSTQSAPVAGSGVNAELGTITRSDGTMQVTVNGLPVYYFANDNAAGDTAGQGVNSVWWVIDADGEKVMD